MFIVGLGTAAPSNRYTQAECWEAFERAGPRAGIGTRAKGLLRRVLLGNNGIAARRFALDSLDDVFQADPDTLHRRFALHAPALASQAAKNALAQASLATNDIDALVISTCTGYLCPGLTSYVSECLGLRSDALLLDLVGQGCGAAVPNLQTAVALVGARRCATVLSICVEVCSAAFFLDDDCGVLISACLFGDGAGAAVVAAEPRRETRCIEWKAAHSLVDTSQREALRFEQTGGMLRNRLTPEVPVLAANAAAAVFDELLRAEGLSQTDIATWIWHAGGRNVLAAVKKRLELDDRAMSWSAQVLRDYGNMSSAFVYFVLDAALRGDSRPGWWWLSSFGAGFSCHGALLKVGEA